MRLFLYLAPQQLDVLRYARLHFLAVGEEDCPYQNNAPIIKQAQPRISEADFQKELKRQFQQLPAQVKGLISWDKFVQGALAKRPQIEAQLKKRIAGKPPQLPNPEVYQQLASLSLSSRPDNPLLWERKAARHQGFVLELDTAHSGFKTKKQLLKPVIYGAERPQADHPKQPFPTLFYKPKEYAAEEEIRLIRPLDEAQGNQTSSNGKQVYFYSFSPKSLISLTLGANCTDETKEQLNKILTYDIKYKPGKPLRQVLLDPYNFKLHIKGTL